MSPEQFVHNYLLDLGAVHVVAGFDYTYGKRGKGNMDRLKEDSGGVLDVTKVEKVEANGEKISSTYIRNKLAAGKVEDLPCLLERPYEVVCNWQGTALQVGTFYTLPAPGRYLVTMKTERLSQLMIAKVVDRRHVIPENGLFSEMLNQQESVTVTWHQRINEKHTEVVMLNDWIQKAMANHVSI